MNKKRVVSIFQVVILIIGLISISYSISEEFHLVSAANLGFINSKTGELSETQKSGFVPIQPDQIQKLNTIKDNEERLKYYLNTNSNKGTPSNIPIPVYKNIYGFGEAAVAKEAGEITSTAADKMTFAQGDAVDGIVSAVAWAVAVVGAVQFIAPFAGANSQQTNAISTAMGMGTFTGTT